MGKTGNHYNKLFRKKIAILHIEEGVSLNEIYSSTQYASVAMY